MRPALPARSRTTMDPTTGRLVMSREDRLRRRALTAAADSDREQQEKLAAARAQHQRDWEGCRAGGAHELKRVLKHRTRPSDWTLGTRERWLHSDDYGSSSTTLYFAEITVEGIQLRYYLAPGQRFKPGMSLLQMVGEDGSEWPMSPSGFGSELRRRQGGSS